MLIEDKLRIKMREEKITQVEMAELLGTTQRRISYVLTRRRPETRLKLKMASILGVRVELEDLRELFD